MSNGGGQPLPAVPGNQRPATHGRERSKSTFSLKSGNSHKSNGSAGKVQYNESHQEKESKRLHSKADPTMAMNEEQPFSMAASAGTNLSNLRALQHKDLHGNIIADPDLSNPTRSRWERPLDTIRAFEAAIDGGYKRQSYAPTDTGSIAPGGRRGSYYAGSNVGAQTPVRQPQDSYYGARQSTYGQQPETRGNGNGYPDQHSGGPSNGYTPNRARYPRSGSDQQMNGNGNGGGPYPNAAYGNQPSYENVTSASGSGSEPLAAGYDGYANGNQQHGVQFNPQPGYNGNGQGQDGYRGGPPPPVQKENVPRVPIKLGGSANAGGQPMVYEQPKAEPTKRKSSFFKRFSKN